MALSKVDPNFLNVSQIGGRRNLIINGAMQVAQRGTISLGAVAGGYGGPDRFRMSNSTDAVLDLKQSTEVPSGQGFVRSYQIDVTTADTSIGASQQSALEYRFEGQDLQMLKKGSSNAEQVTLSFWVRSPVTGTHVVELEDTDNTRAISQSYTVDSADTWQFVSLIYEGDTSGSLNNDNSLSVRIRWYFDVGTNFSSGTLATSWQPTNAADRVAGQTTGFFASVNNNWYITGVQLEVGDTATPFEHRSYGEELALCQRYFHIIEAGSGERALIVNGSAYSSSEFYGVFNYPVQMRASPSCSVDFSSNDLLVYGNNGSGSISSGDVNFDRADVNAVRIYLNNLSLVQGYGYWAELNNTANYKAIKIDAEL